MHNRLSTLAAALTLLAAAPRAGAQASTAAARDTVPLTLEQAVERATSESQEVRLARSQVSLAETQVSTARAGAFPQLTAQLGYTRTFASAFSGGGGFTLPDSLKFEPDSTASLAERVSYLERRAPSAGLGGLGALFGNLPFGQPNSYTATLNGSQILFSGGKVGAALRIADSYLQAARFELNEQTAEIELQVRSAYYRARLAQELAGISREAVDQAQRFLATERIRHEAGTGSELDVLRAEVSLANLQPPLIDAVNAAAVATLDLKRLVDIPLEDPVKLTTPLDVSTIALAADTLALTSALLARRSSVASLERQVAIREQQVRIARGNYLPSVNLNVAYGKQLFPSQLFSFNEQWRTDFTAGVSVSVPIFNGGRTRAEVAAAQVQLDQERLRLTQLRENVQLDYERARGERERTRASIAARQRTVQQAQRVYDLTVLRYEQGLASQLEVSEARLSLLQARTNLAQAGADFQIANARVSRALGTPIAR